MPSFQKMCDPCSLLPCFTSAPRNCYQIPKVIYIFENEAFNFFICCFSVATSMSFVQVFLKGNVTAQNGTDYNSIVHEKNAAVDQCAPQNRSQFVVQACTPFATQMSAWERNLTVLWARKAARKVMESANLASLNVENQLVIIAEINVYAENHVTYCEKNYQRNKKI